MPTHTLPTAIYVFAQPCDLTLSWATSTLGQAERQVELWPLLRISPSCTYTDTFLLLFAITHIWPLLKEAGYLHRCKAKSQQYIPHYRSPPDPALDNVYEGCKKKRRFFSLLSVIQQFPWQTSPWFITTSRLTWNIKTTHMETARVRQMIDRAYFKSMWHCICNKRIHAVVSYEEQQVLWCLCTWYGIQFNL